MGYEAGIKQGTTLIRYQPIVPTKKINDNFLIPSSELPFTDEMIQISRTELIQITKTVQPTETQWQIILCKQRNTRIIAGAGSGKTTTMILRIIVLRYYLDIPWKEITVFSFTNKSVNDFRKKLIDITSNFGKPIKEKEATNVVTTFHAKILKFHRNDVDTNDNQIFDQFGDKDTTDIFLKSKLTIQQNNYLRRCYEELYEANEKFKRKIKNIRAVEALGGLGEKSKASHLASRLKQIENRDEKLTKDVHRVFSASFTSKFQCEEYCKITGKFKEDSVVLHSNIFIEKYHLHILFHPFDKGLISSLMENDYDGINIVGALSVKTKIIWNMQKDADIYIVNSETDVRRLIESLKENSDFAPPIQFCLPGEPVKKVIWEYFYTFLGLIQSINLTPHDFVRVVLKDNSSRIKIKHYEYDFLEAFIIYDEYLQLDLNKNNFTLYNTVFNKFSEHNVSSLETSQLAKEVGSMSNLIIDEFQDISPIIISWLKAVLTKLKTDDLPSSIMVVGDDWQCIYGWRGSSPHILNESFDRYFTSKNKSKVINLVENFRSGQVIIDKAEKVFSDLKSNKTKHGISATKKKSTFDVMLYKNEKEIIDTILSILRNMPTGYDESKLYLMVLATRRTKFLSLEATIGKRIKLTGAVLFSTIHSSKGLESEIVVAVDESYYPNPCPIKDKASALADFQASFHKSATDEAKRVVYVAITRAKTKIVYFISDDNKEGVIDDYFVDNSQ